MRKNTYYFLLALILFECVDKTNSYDSTQKLFTRLSVAETGIDFINQLEDSEEFNVFKYKNYFNGAGVAIGDLNNDGLPDLFLTSNLQDNKLYLNKGNLKFEDITDHAGVAGSKFWSTGVAMADVNADGWLDIYVCNSGDIDGNNMENELFINNQDGTFTESAQLYGLADRGYSTHAVFFDYDGDGDLDCYLLNNSFRPISTLGYKNLRLERDPQGGDKLFRNDGGKFKDISEEAGIYGSVIGFGLGVSVGDVNRDGHPDLFVSNDFYERDYLYINKGDGTFKESLTEFMDQISMFSMGADVADLNNDGFPEIFTTDMLPESDRRLKTTTAFETYDVHQLRVNNGYFFQFMRNTLQLNEGGKHFNEISNLANLASTDWSWGALMVDLDNNGKKEVFVSNGIFKDLTNQDFIEFLASEKNMQAALAGEQVDFQEFVDKMPSEKLINYLFVQDSSLQFINKADEWGFGEPSFSNGAAYGDLDGDGDLDLVINNVNQELFVYKNNTERDLPNHHFLAINFEGPEQNPFGLGANVSVFRDQEILYYEHMPIRGFQSSMDYKMIIGLGPDSEMDSIIVNWPGGRQQKLGYLDPNQTHILKYQEAKEIKGPTDVLPKIPLLQNFTDSGIDFVHTENNFNEFDIEKMIFQMLSTEGPAFAVADLTGNGLDDIYMGGAKDQSSALYLQIEPGKFSQCEVEDFNLHTASEDVAAVFFDANQDGKVDLLVVSGGSEFAENSPQLRDRLYLNQSNNPSRPIFKYSETALPTSYLNGSIAAVNDINGDGFMDLFIGSRKHNTYYGLHPTHQILINDGMGNFTDQTDELAPGLMDLGMVTDASWVDLDGQGNKSLILVGDWMPITVFENVNGKLVHKQFILEGAQEHAGWWNTLKSADLNKDGLPDLIIGNAGLNNKLKPTVANPNSLYVHDFDNNGSTEQIHTYHRDGKDYPMHPRHDMVRQMIHLKRKFLTYADYAGKTITEVLDEDLVAKAKILKSYLSETVVLINQGNGKFTKSSLPLEAQYTTMKAIEVFDLDQDGNLDILMAGNFYEVKPELGKFDSSRGVVLKGDGKGGFKVLPASESGLLIPGQTRHLKILNQSLSTPLIMAVRNDQDPMMFKVVQK